MRESSSIPQGVRENICTDTIYATSLAGDDWDKVVDPSQPGGFPTYQYNTAENAFYYLRRIRDNWAANAFDNAIALIGVVLHETGDAVDIVHNKTIRDYYEEFIPPIGSEEPLWETHRYHWGSHQVEAYSDTDSHWYPRKPENYGPDDDGSLEWFLNNYFYNPAINSDSPADDYGTFIGRLIRKAAVDEDWSENDWDDNIWFYWVHARDPAVPKWLSDHTIRLVYNGVYRALRDGERARLGNPPNFDTDIWPWPTSSEWLSLPENFYGEAMYKEGMDTARWYRGIAAAVAPEAEESQSTAPPPYGYWPLMILGLFLAAAFLWLTWRRREGNVE
jgi:hypothetical protein